MNISKLRNTAEDGKGIFAEWIGGNWIDRNSVIIVFTQKSANFDTLSQKVCKFWPF